MSTGAGILATALKHVGEAYEFVQVPKNNPNWHGPWDCAEFVSWVVFQDAGILYGCLNDEANPAIADAYTGAWTKDLEKRGIRISVAQAAATVGAIVLRYPPGSGMMGHIAISDGRGGTVEAKSHKDGVVTDVIDGRRWDAGILVPGVYYDTDVVPAPVQPPADLYYIGGANMKTAKVRDIQRRLRTAGFDPGPVDGIYGAKTSAAVAAFQATEGVVVDGEVGPETAAALGVDL